MTDPRIDKALAYINEAEREKRQKITKFDQQCREECILLTRKLQYMLDNPGHYDSTIDSLLPRNWVKTHYSYHTKCPELQGIIDEVNNNGGPIKVSLYTHHSFVTDVKTTTNGSAMRYTFWYYKP